MLRAVRNVSEELLRRYVHPPFNLEQITGAVKAITTIEKIFFVGYPASRQNPIWGSFQKYAARPSVYAPQDTIVEIRYALHLSEIERRFTVCKELCHALDEFEGSHSASDRSVERLVAGFSLLSSNEKLTRMGQPLAAELMAEMVAAELICPIRVRRRALGEQPCDVERQAQLAREHGIPDSYGSIAFNVSYMDMIEVLLQNGS